MAVVTPFEVRGVRGELHAIKPTRGSTSHRHLEWDDGDVPDAARTAYAVVVDGKRIGVVSSKMGTSHRKAGRLIVATSHPKEWVATICGFYRRSRRADWRPVAEGYQPSYYERNAGDWYQQRADATRRVVELWQELTG